MSSELVIILSTLCSCATMVSYVALASEFPRYKYDNIFWDIAKVWIGMIVLILSFWGWASFWSMWES